MMLFILKVLTWDKTILEPVIMCGMIGYPNYLKFFSKPLNWINIFEFVNSYRYIGNNTCEKVIHQRNCCWVMESLCNALLRCTITYPWFKFKNVISTVFSDYNLEYIPANVSKRDIANVARFIATFNEKHNVEMLTNIKIFIQRSVDIYKVFEADSNCYASFKEQAVQDRHSAAWGILDTMHLTGICVALDENYGERENLIKLCNCLEVTLGHITKLEKLNIYRNLSYLLKNRYNVWVDQDVISTRVFGENSVQVMRTSRIPF
ncbi:hypothetical protein BMR1_02g02190 [Babesia microti strain RI]|uniref:Uncharacterized protein n=1 Tax=Babesia microti (strain RI) TaxID=1133968 RepID=A0A1R4AAE9_BABMR|nr:hypothetical protein BMR1_02g02190 [Babesia microti strain RI]SJK85972.1 hypothetical protein BMR1_02g02190 [Babesia microti strain RI]|eukprot:XP_021338174.1 hypothetical protein BMR1_02g02190 [Babesia microti strain RI]